MMSVSPESGVFNLEAIWLTRRRAGVYPRPYVSLRPREHTLDGPEHRPLRSTENGSQVGHQTHFLERLERASAIEAELALELYRSPDTLRFVLDRAGCDPHAGERVALSLSEGDCGPFVLVGADGAFVTCLGRGMGLGEARLVSHARLSACIEQARKLEESDRLRRRLKDEERIDVGDPSWPGRSGLKVSREEIAAFRPLQPAVSPHRLYQVSARGQSISDSRLRLQRIRRPKPRHRRLLEVFWRQFWAVGHDLVLGTMTGSATLGEHAALIEDPGFNLIEQAFALGGLPVGVRAVWAAGKLGKPVVANLKRTVREVDEPLMWLGAVAALIVVGARHRKLHKEVMSAFSFGVGEKGVRPRTAAFLVEHDLQDVVAELMLSGSSPEAAEELNTELCRQAVFEIFDEPRPPGLDVSSPEELPADLARCILANMPLTYSASPKLLGYIFSMLPWLARAEAEDLYLPRDLLEAGLGCPFDPENAVELAQELHAHRGRPAPVRAASKVGRNDPCPCGSGKKFKKCCMRREEAPR